MKGRMAIEIYLQGMLKKGENIDTIYKHPTYQIKKPSHLLS